MISENHKYQRKELELKALLEITQAINENQSESVLVNIFKFTCLVHLNINSLVLYVLKEGGFEKKIAHGIKGSVPEFIPENEVTDSGAKSQFRLDFEERSNFSEFETALPVYHKEKMLAILFLRSKDPELELNLNFTQAIANILVVALENKRFARKQVQQEVLNREVAIASQVQQMLFPSVLPNQENLKAKVTYIPHSMVGGDYYDFIQQSEDVIYFCVADVSGKGISAALLMSNFQAALRTLLRTNTDLETIVHQLNFTLFENTNGERFITFFLGRFNLKTRQLHYVNAGHNPPILCYEAKQSSELLEAGTTILGAFERLPFLEVGHRDLPANFTIHLYTDGLTETLDESEQEFGDQRLQNFVSGHLCMNPEDFHREFLDVLSQFSGKVPLHDDLTLFSIRVK
ncbi:PP2C family protein-serine/threonine phosphatase [Algoriphagus hitonicola]|uniref:Sigma-B regulation protein RsbU (Phosphoserine phosphatase) n=1 Tax=Algoriphagus hitonicola TaxID=435880 RepID=A0A1I2V9G8_9BACT|nr:PP2C family protein-serine/threonine phosphatase [Algoriphagus hitonicola]SFG85099.1 sigma-B regulation protein RsbU (phosphoserine phosphatase) [Algoriphagus hitonicola]